MRQRNHFLDALRGIAVVFVLLFHAFPGLLPGGYLGVDIFFVLAGYLSVQSLDKRSETLSGLFSYPVARLSRLAPAFFVVLILTAVFSALLIPAPDDAIMVNSHQASIGLNFDNYLTESGKFYFAPTEEYNPYLHLWTISVEIKYYFLIFCIYLAAWPLCLWRFRLVRHQRAFRVLILTCIVVVSFALFVHDQAASYYTFSSRVWQFGFGSLLAFWLSKSTSTSFLRPSTHFQATLLKSWFWGLLVAMLMLLLGATWFSPASVQVGAHLYTVFFALLAIYSSVRGLEHAQDTISILRRPLGTLFTLLASLGIISYSLYLVHWPLVVFARWTIGLDSPFIQSCVLMLSLVLGFLLYKTVEDRTIGLNHAVLLCVVAFVAVLPSQLKISHPSKLPKFYLGSKEFSPDDLGGPGFKDEQLEQTINGRCEDDASGQITNKGVQIFERCHVKYNGRPNIFLFGDSSAGILKKQLSIYAEDKHVGLSIHAVDGCFVPDLGAGAGCGLTLRAYLEYVRVKWKPGDIVVASYNWMGWTSGGGLSHSSSALKLILDQLPAGAPTYILGPYPIWDVREPIRCFANFGYRPKPCMQSAAGVISTSKYLSAEIQALKSQAIRPIYFVDLPSALCVHRMCSVLSKDGSRLVYKDDGHVTNYGSSLIVQRLLSSISNSSSH
jgi:peptidoglycan/LPS O-acetylase OafA/YrhL